MGLGERAAEDGEVLGEDVDQAAINATRSRHHAIARRAQRFDPEAGGAVGDEAVELQEGAGIEQQLQTLARSELPLGVLLGDARGAATLQRLGLPAMEFLERCSGLGHA